LLLLALFPLFHRWWSFRNRGPKINFSISIPKKLRRFDPFRILLITKYLGIAFLIIGLARPQSSYRQTERSVSGIDIMMVMDVSASMNIEDLDDRARFDVAKQTMEKFVSGRQDDRIGFIVFSGEPLTLTPLTLDYGLVLKSIRDAASGVLKDGTGIGDGLSLAVTRLRDSKAKSRIIVLLTDGDNNVGQVDPATAGDLAAGFGIKVYTIAIGREGRVKMPIKSRGAFGNEVVSYQYFENALNPTLLKQIADVTGGRFYRVTEAGVLDEVFQEINQLEKSEVKSTERTRFDDRFALPLRLGSILLIAERVLSYGVWRMLL
jgi:Ca-activated chloride channel family protein